MPEPSIYVFCESPAEEAMLDALMKAYSFNDIQPQYEAGRYRIDFVTRDMVGWEVDGKQWHDKEKDYRRDSWILANTEIQMMVRIEAAALMFFRDACLAGLSRKVAAFTRFRRWCRDETEWMNEATELFKQIEYGGLDARTACDAFAAGECYDAIGSFVSVGSPVAFLPFGHGLTRYLNRRDQHSWTGKILIRGKP